jgi:uncharacterized membrane protein YphA (DoxX/SURF4 family)
MRSIVFGIAFLFIAGIVLTSPSWLFREMTRPNDEQLPAWMGDAQARKKRLLVILGVLALIIGGFAVAAGLSEQ